MQKKRIPLSNFRSSLTITPVRTDGIPSPSFARGLSADDAADIEQETLRDYCKWWIRVHGESAGPPPTEGHHGLVFTIARSRVTDLMRKLRNRVYGAEPIDFQAQGEGIPSAEPTDDNVVNAVRPTSPVEKVLLKDRTEYLKARLKPGELKLLTMMSDGMTASEIASALEMSNVDQKLQYIKRKCMKILAQYDTDN